MMLWTAELAVILGLLKLFAGLDSKSSEFAEHVMFGIWSIAVIAHVAFAAIGYATLQFPDDQFVRDRKALTATVAWCVIPVLIWMMGCLVLLGNRNNGFDASSVFRVAEAHLIPVAIAIRWQLHRDRGKIQSGPVNMCRYVSLFVGLMPGLIAICAALN